MKARSFAWLSSVLVLVLAVATPVGARSWFVYALEGGAGAAGLDEPGHSPLLRAVAEEIGRASCRERV